MLIFYLHCNLYLRISGITIICYIKTRTNVNFSLYLKKAGLASRNIVHFQKIILRCVGFCFCILQLQLFRQRLSHKSVKAYATMPIGIMGRKSLALID